MARSSLALAPVATPSPTAVARRLCSRGRLPPACQGLGAVLAAAALPPGSFSASVASTTSATTIVGEESRETTTAVCRAGPVSESEKTTMASTASTGVKMAVFGGPAQKVVGQRRRASHDRRVVGPALPMAMRPSMAETAAICLLAIVLAITSAATSREVPAKACQASQIGLAFKEVPSVRPCASVASISFSRTAKSTREAGQLGLTGMAFSPSMAPLGRLIAQAGQIGRRERPSTKALASL